MIEKTIPDVKASTTDEVWSLMEKILQLETDYKDRVKLTSDEERTITNQVLKLLDESVQ